MIGPRGLWEKYQFVRRGIGTADPRPGRRACAGPVLAALGRAPRETLLMRVFRGVTYERITDLLNPPGIAMPSITDQPPAAIGQELAALSQALDDEIPAKQASR